MSPAVALPDEKPLNDYYLLVQPWSVYVKGAATFEAQGGTRSVWGKGWRKVSAVSIDAAREIGEASRKANTEAKLKVSLHMQEYLGDALTC